MKKNAVLELLQNASQLLPKQQRQICNYILANPYETCMLTIQQLAELNQVGTSTVARLMTSLGFSGYNDFKRALHDTVFQDDTQKPRMGVDLDKQLLAYHGKSDTESMCLYLHSVQSELQMYENPALLEALADASHRIMAAKRLYVFGQTAYRGISEYFQWTMQRFVGPIVQLGQTDFFFEEMQRMTPEDLLVMFCPIVTKKMADIAAYARCCHIQTLIFASGAAAQEYFADVGSVIQLGEEHTLGTLANYAVAIGLVKAPIVRCKGGEAEQRFEEIRQQLEELDILDDSISAFSSYQKTN